MGEPGVGVEQSRWEIAFWLCMGAAGVLQTTTATSTAGLLFGIGLVLTTTLGVASSRRIHRTRPDILSQRIPSEILWLVGLTVVLLGALAVSEPRFADKLFLGLLALGGVLVVITDRTRQVPRDVVIVGQRGGYFDPMTPEGFRHRRRAIEAAWLVALLVLAVIGIAGNSIGFVFLSWGVIGLATFEIFTWMEDRRRKRKTPAGADDERPDLSA